MRLFKITLCVMLGILSTVSLGLAAESVTPSDIDLVKVLSPNGNGASTTVSCFNTTPGSVASKNGVLSFRSFATDIRRLRAKGNSARLRQKIQLRKRGHAACAVGSSKTKVPLSDAGLDPSSSISLALSNSSEVGIPLDAIQRADSVRSNATISDVVAALQSAISCADLSLTDGALLVDFGTGCAVSGITFSGSATAALSLNSGVLTITFSTSNLSAYGFTLNGTSAFGLAQGSLAINLDTDVTKSSTTTSLEFVGTVEDDDTGFTIDGTGEFSSSSLTGEFVVTNLHKLQNGSCYPNSGTVVVTLDSAPSITLTFSEATASTGVITIQIGSAATTKTLPACGS